MRPTRSSSTSRGAEARLYGDPDPDDPAAHHPARQPRRGGSTPTPPGTSAAASRSSPGLRGDSPLRRSEPLHARSAAGRALEDAADAHLEGGRRHLPPDAGAAAPEPEFGNPNLPPIWADQYSVGFVRTLTREADARHDALLRPPPRPAGAAAAVHVRRAGALVRHGADPEARVHREVLRLDRLHAVALGADGLRRQLTDARPGRGCRIRARSSRPGSRPTSTRRTT